MFMFVILGLKFYRLYQNFEEDQKDEAVASAKEKKPKRMNLIDTQLGLTALSRYADEVMIFISNFSFFDAIYKVQ
jgi:hypothetical protein